MHRSTARRSVALASLSILLPASVLLAGSASAHVSVSSADAAKEGYGKVVFRVPNEEDAASTTRLVVTTTDDAPLVSARTQPVPGWTAKVAMKTLPEPIEVGDLKVTEVVGSITWTASKGAGIAPGEFQEFAVSGGPFPDADTMAFDARQVYDDGTTVDWDQEQTGDEEPEHPAPTVALLDADEGGHAHGGATDDTTAATRVEEAVSSSDSTARWIGGVGVAVGAAGVLLGLRKNRDRA